MTNIGALYGRCVGVFPGFRATEDIVDLFPHQVHLVLELGLNTVNIRARAAKNLNSPTDYSVSRIFEQVELLSTVKWIAQDGCP